MYDFVEDISWWQDWMVAVLVALAFAFVWLVDRVIKRADRPIAADWAQSAERLGATFTSSKHGMSEMLISGHTPEGVSFTARRVFTDQYGGVWTQYTAAYTDPTLPEFLVVGKGEVTAKARHPKIKTGHDRFDDALRIRSRDERTAVYMTPQLLEIVLDLVGRFSEVRVTHTGFSMRSKGLETDPEILYDTIMMLRSALRVLSPQLALTPTPS